MIARIFYVTQGSLQVWQPGASSLRPIAQFADDDAGIQDFERYLANDPDRASTMLIDVIEEEFSLDSVPKLGARDRAALIERRSERKYRRTPYRASMFQGKSERRTGEFSVVHSAILNHELVDPWLEIILRHKTPLGGVHSVPLMAADTIRRLFSVSGSVMFVAQHQGQRLRQIFSRNGKIRSARLSQSPPVTGEDYAQFIITETMRSRRYLERTRLLGANETLEIVVVANAATANRILSSMEPNSPNRFHFTDPESAARKLGVPGLADEDHFEEVFVHSAAKKLPKYSYATGGENRYWLMRKIRSAVLLTSTVAAAACSIVAALLLSDLWILKTRNFDIQSQAEFLAETFRRENNKFDPIKADSFEMQLAVDTGDYLLANRVPVPWVMNQLGAVLGDFSDVQIQGIRWSAEADVPETAQQGRRDANAPVTAPAIRSVGVVITAALVPFNGDMRFAFSRIDSLVSDLESRTDFTTAQAIEYPFNTSTAAAVSGEIFDRRANHEAQFQIRLALELANNTTRSGAADESI